jgi:hypothetical protein
MVENFGTGELRSYQVVWIRAQSRNGLQQKFVVVIMVRETVMVEDCMQKPAAGHQTKFRRCECIRCESDVHQIFVVFTLNWRDEGVVNFNLTIDLGKEARRKTDSRCGIDMEGTIMRGRLMPAFICAHARLHRRRELTYAFERQCLRKLAIWPLPWIVER